MANQIVLYVRLNSGVCRKAKEFLDTRGIPFLELDIEHDSAAKEAFKKLGASTVPTFEISGKLLVGFQPERLKELLREARTIE